MPELLFLFVALKTCLPDQNESHPIFARLAMVIGPSKIKPGSEPSIVIIASTTAAVNSMTEVAVLMNVGTCRPVPDARRAAARGGGARFKNSNSNPYRGSSCDHTQPRMALGLLIKIKVAEHTHGMISSIGNTRQFRRPTMQSTLEIRINITPVVGTPA